MIIKAQKPKLDGSELEDVIDLSINIGNSASPSTASITFVGDKAESVAQTLTNNSLLEVGGIKFYGNEYSVSTSDGEGGLTSTLEMIDQSFDILDRFYVDLNISNHGNGSINSSGDYIFVGSEYYSYTERTYSWSQSKRSWEVDNRFTVGNATLSRSQYVPLYENYRDTYNAYERALKNIEAFQGRDSQNLSSVCTDQEIEPSDALLLPGGQFASSAQVILNFPSMTNPKTTKGEIFYRGSDIPRNPFGGNALFNATGSLRSVISAIAGQVGKSWYWDCTQDYSSSGGVKEAPDASSAQPYEAKGHSYTKGMTRANSFAEGLIYKRYIEGEEAGSHQNEWLHSESGINGSVFEDAIDAFDLNPPGTTIGSQALLYLELGEELYKALWINFEGSSSSGKFNKLEEKVIKAKAFAGNTQLGALIDGGEERDGTPVSGQGTHELKWYNPSDWEGHLAEILEATQFIGIWRACGPSGDEWSGGTMDSSDQMSTRFPYREDGKFVDPTLRQVTTGRGHNIKVEYFPVVNEVVGYLNMCLVKGSASVFSENDLIKNITHGQIFSILEGDSACSDTDKLDEELGDYISTRHIVLADNSTWSYEFPACVKEKLTAWSDGAVVEIQSAIGPMELGKDVTKYSSFTEDGLVAIKPLTDFGSWSEILSDYKKLITSDKVTIRSHFKRGSDGYIDDALYSESFSSRLCSNGKGKANWAIQTMETGAEVNTSQIDQIKSFGEAQCIDKTPFISYTLHGEWDSIEDIGDLDSISVTYGSSGISSSYSRSFKKSISPSALLFSGLRKTGTSAAINMSSAVNRFSTKFKNMAFARQPPRASLGSVKRGK